LSYTRKSLFLERNWESFAIEFHSGFTALSPGRSENYSQHDFGLNGKYVLGNRKLLMFALLFAQQVSLGSPE
jgi:hypothetical protein